MTAKHEKKLKQIIDPVLASAFAHPLRGHIMVTAAEVGETSPSQVGAELGLPAHGVSYHFRRLRRSRLIKQVRTAQRRGFTEHFYSLSKPIFQFDDEEWARIPPELRNTFSGEMAKNVCEEMHSALKAGSLGAEQAHFSRVWVVADQQAQDEMSEVDKEALKQKMAIKANCEKRLKGAMDQGVQMTFLTVSFESAQARE